MTITEFLLARIAEDEAVARAADVKQGDPAWKVCDIALGHPRAKRVRSERDSRPIAWVEDVAGDDDADTTGILDGAAAADHIARHDPARVLAECEAKRRIVELALGYMPNSDDDDGSYCIGIALAALASVYADHPDYNPGWAIRLDV